MPRENRVICDYCRRDLTTAERGGWRLELCSEHVPPTTRGPHDLRAWRDRSNPLPEDTYFCSYVCLAGWLARHPQRDGDFEPNERPLGKQCG